MYCQCMATLNRVAINRNRPKYAQLSDREPENQIEMESRKWYAKYLPVAKHQPNDYEKFLITLNMRLGCRS